LLALIDGPSRDFMRLDRLGKGIAFVVVGVAWVILCTSAAAAYRAEAASCWDPVVGWRCSQTAGSDDEFAAKVFDALTIGGLALVVAGFCLSLSGVISRERDDPGNAV